MPNNYLSVLYKHIIQVENKNLGLKVGGGGGGGGALTYHCPQSMPPLPPLASYVSACTFFYSVRNNSVCTSFTTGQASINHMILYAIFKDYYYYYYYYYTTATTTTATAAASTTATTATTTTTNYYYYYYYY